MDFKPLFDKILVKESADQPTGAALILSSAAEGYKRGTVVSAGDGRPGSVMTVKEGMAVMYRKEDASDVTVDGEDYKLMRESDVWMIKKGIDEKR